MIILHSSEYLDGWWHVHCSIELADGTRIGVHSVELPETATDEEIKEAILALY